MRKDLSEVRLGDIGLEEDAFSNRVAIITGSGRGIGRDAAIILSRLGAGVVIAELDQNGESVEREIRLNGGNSLFVQTDVSSENSVDQMILKTLEAFGKIDILINNAILCPVKAVKDMSAEEWDEVVAVNLRGTFLCTRKVLDNMLINNTGTIINMVSAPSMPYLTAYVSTKNAIEAFSHSLAGELRDTGISVIAFGPGMADTPGGVDAFRKLASLYGMSYEEFTRNGMNKGYSGLLPSYDCALAIAKVAYDSPVYDNETVLAVDILEKLEISSIGQNGDGGEIEESEKGKRSFTENTAFVRSLVETGEEVQRFPFFVRPMIKAGFRKKVGISIEGLKEFAEKSSELCRQNAVSDDAREFLERMLSYLDGVETYYREAPAEAARFVKLDRELGRIAEISTQRINATIAFRNGLKGFLKAGDWQ